MSDQRPIEVILGNSNKRFSGVTSTMLQTLAHQKHLAGVRVMGAHHLPDPSLAISFWQAARLLRKPLPDGSPRVFHARRNDEIIQALLLKHLFGAKIKILFTSTAQRHHSGFSRWLMSKVDSVISTCQAAASYLRTPPDKLIPHGIDAEGFQSAANKSEAWRALGHPGNIGLGIFGRVRKQKGVHHFVKACIAVLPEFPEASAVVVGQITDDNRDFADQLAADIAAAGLSERIILRGELAFTEVKKYFSAVSVLAALSNNEGFGLTVLEGMASEAAVIATRAGAWPEIVREDIDGHLVEVDDVDAIADRMRCLLSNPAQTQAMGVQARQRVLENYTVQKEAATLVEHYRSLQAVH